jgi:arsenate reductase
MAKVTIYHNPRCTKSRETLALLKEHGEEPGTKSLRPTPTAGHFLDRRSHRVRQL